MELSKLNSIPMAQMAEIKPHSEGWWNGRLASYAMDDGEDKNGKRVQVSLFFTAEEPLEGQETKHISTNRRYPHRIRIYKEEDTARVIELGKRLRPDLPTPSELQERGEDGGNLQSYLEQLINAPARVVLEIDQWVKENKDRVELVVKQVRKAAA